MDFKQLHADKIAEMKEKYKDVIFDLSVKDEVDEGVAFDELKAIAYASLEGLPVMYDANIEFDLVEVIRDYAELRYYSNNCR